ncbi:MAG: T9SS type A sorting domain-containing protein [Bacteroidota bacterium]
MYYFEASITHNKTVALRWQTSQETDHDYFTVERSADGTTWEMLRQIKGAGNAATSQNYTLEDTTPFPDTSYYRLQQTDFDGRSEYLGIQPVHLRTSQPTTLHVYPNPADDFVVITQAEAELGTLRLYNLLGQDVTSSVTITRPDHSTARIDLSTLDQGIYFVKTENGNSVFSVN